MFLFCFRALFICLAFSKTSPTFYVFFLSLSLLLSIAFSPKDRSSQRSTTRFVHAGHVGPGVSPQLLLPGIQADRTRMNRLLFLRIKRKKRLNQNFKRKKRIQTILAFYAKQILRDLSYFYILSYSSRMFYHVSFISQSEGCWQLNDS